MTCQASRYCALVRLTITVKLVLTLTVREDGLIRNADDGLEAAEPLSTYLKPAKRNKHRKQAVSNDFLLDNLLSPLTLIVQQIFILTCR